MALRFDGKVAVVTGAGGGLGREYALLLAERGASVVVNDLGGTRGGEGQSRSAADKVVDEIRAKGGKAVADYNSVEEGDKIIKTAVDNFGRIDIVINNAGILRDKAFVNMTTDEWDIIHRVHLRGSFLVTKAAWPYFRKQGYGKIIMTASGAGIYGNFGQANYGSAKLGLLGLSNTLAIEGKKYNISCNTIVPLAASRLTEDVFPTEVFKQLKPSFVSPVVVWLCHESCSENGGVFEAAGGYVGKYQWHRSVGKAFISDDKMTPESVRDSWAQITDMTDSLAMASVHDQTASLIQMLSGQVPQKTSTGASSSTTRDPSVFVYTPDSAILYALSVGLSTQHPDHLKFLYENSEDFGVLPTFGVIPAMSAVFNSEALSNESRRLNVDPSKMLHGEQYLELYRPLPPSGTLKTDVKVVDILDKKSGALAIVDAHTFDENGQKIAYTQWSVFFVGSGNFGGKRDTDKSVPLATIPKRKPDAVLEDKTSTDQAALYRLCGDKNPLHIDPNFAAAGGFPQPILHGLCSYGYAARHILKQYANNDVRRFKSIKARFTGPVMPGQSIRTEMWKEGNKVVFQCMVPESNKQIISGGWVELIDGPPVSGPSPPPAAVPQRGGSELMSKMVFAGMSARVAESPDLVKKVDAIYEYHITRNGKEVGVWTLDLKNGLGAVYEGPVKNGRPNCVINIDDEDMFNMAVGQLDPQKAFMQGKLKVKGNILMMQRLRALLTPPTGGSTMPSSAPPTSTTSASPAIKSDVIFKSMDKKVAANPDLISTVKTIFQWDIKKNGQLVKQYTLDLRNGKGAIYEGACKQGKPDCVLIMEDDVLYDIYTGKLDAQRAFMTGKLKITGNVLASQKLQDLWEQDKEENSDDEAARLVQSADSAASEERPPPPTEPPSTVKSDFIFGIFTEYHKQEPQIASIVKTIYHWIIVQQGKKATEWTVDLKNGEGNLYKGPPSGIKADVTITIEDEDLIQLLLGKLNPQKAFMTGRLKIRGNIMLTQRFNQLWQEILKSGRVVELKLISSLLSDGQPLSPDLWSDCAFFILTKKLAHLPDLAPKVQAIYEWRILKEGREASKWTLDLKNEVGSVYRGSPKDGSPACTITMDDDLFANLVAGRIAPKAAFSKFVKIQGNAALTDSLHPLFMTQSKL